jgi:hypothetical protein
VSEEVFGCCVATVRFCPFVLRWTKGLVGWFIILEFLPQFNLATLLCYTFIPHIHSLQTLTRN